MTVAASGEHRAANRSGPLTSLICGCFAQAGSAGDKIHVLRFSVYLRFIPWLAGCFEADGQTRMSQVVTAFGQGR